MQDRRFSVTVLVICAVLVILALPFVFVGWWMEPAIEQFTRSEWPAQHRGLAVLAGIGLLVSDIVLPVPNSVVCTMLGSLCGPVSGSIASWTGLSLSVLTGYFMARTGCRLLGRPGQIHQWSGLQQAQAGWILALCRPMPLLGESSVVAAGLFRMPLKSFFAPVLMSNAVVAVGWSAFGWWARDRGMLFQALLLSALIPVAALASWIVLRKWPRRNRAGKCDSTAPPGNGT